MSNIIRRHKVAALLSVAVIIGAATFTLYPVGSAALAASQDAGSTSAVTGTIPDVVAADKPAVVTITSTMKSGDDDGGQSGSPMDEQFRRFFEQQGIPMPQQQQKPAAQTSMALGSGFIIDADGIIVTNNHVVDKATSIRVTLDDGTELPAKLLGADPKADLAVVKVDSKDKLPTVAWGDSDKLKLGDTIIAIGNPFGIGTTVTAGIVSARGRDLHSGPYDDFIQIDAPINHGNSGGPLVDLDGKVVGINTAIYSPNGGSVGVGFAIPSDEAKVIVAKLQKSGSIDHGFIGVQIQPVTKDVADALGLAKPEGALIADVGTDTPAARAGLRSGDVVTAVGDKQVRTPKDLSRVIADLSPGDKETVAVWRDGKSQDLTVVVGGNDGEVRQAKADKGEANQPSIGVGLADLTPDIREQLNLPTNAKGVAVASVSPDKPAADAGIQTGDVILSVNSKSVGSAAEVKEAVGAAAKSGRKSVLLQIERDGKKTFVAVPFSAS